MKNHFQHFCQTHNFYRFFTGNHLGQNDRHDRGILSRFRKNSDFDMDFARQSQCFPENIDFHVLYSLRSFLKPLFLLFTISLLVMSQPDLGSTAIICLLVVAILFYAGISFFQFSLLSILIALLGYMAISTSPMRLARVLAFTDPFAEDIVRNAGWQLSNSLISIGQGGWFGLGIGNSFQKNFFLPEAHTDFIFAILVEELGIIGGLFLIFLFLILFIGILKVALDSFSKDRLFQGYASFGILILIAIQSLFNIAVNIGLLPTKGLTLPFISYGGTSIIIMMSLIAIVLRINKENKLI